MLRIRNYPVSLCTAPNIALRRWSVSHWRARACRDKRVTIAPIEWGSSAAARRPSGTIDSGITPDPVEYQEELIRPVLGLLDHDGMRIHLMRPRT
jgi:hypothetical protein